MTTLADNKQQFQKEQNELLKVVLNERFFKPFAEGPMSEPSSLWSNSDLEIYITNACNQHCEYCYFIKHPELYDAPKDSKTLLKNLHILLDYMVENNYIPATLDLFSGEIWHTQFGLDVLNTILEYVRNGWNVPNIMISSNCSFIMNREQFHKIQTIINQFNTTGTVLHFSLSVDGKYIDEQFRPRNNENDKYLDEFYDLLFAFAKKNVYYFHPMVSSKNVKYWIENYKWWLENLQKYGLNPNEYLMMLEVRNPDWTEESIQQYNEFMDYLLDLTFNNDCGGKLDVFANTILTVRTHNSIPMNGYFPYLLCEAYNFPCCSIPSALTVRLGDLAICPCHRTAYHKYLYGKFVVENDHIVDIEANNVNMAIQILMPNVHQGFHGCDTCIYSKFCLHGCFGAQLEELGDPFFPIENVCNFFRKKYSHLIQKYVEYGVVDYALQIAPSEPNYEHAIGLLQLYWQWKELQ